MRLDYPFDIGDLRGLPVSSLLSDCKPGRGHQVESDAVSEWSKELALGASPVRVAGSNPVRIRPFFLYTPSCILSCLSSTSSCQSTTMSFASQFSPIFEPPGIPDIAKRLQSRFSSRGTDSRAAARAWSACFRLSRARNTRRGRRATRHGGQLRRHPHQRAPGQAGLRNPLPIVRARHLCDRSRRVERGGEGWGAAGCMRLP